MRNLDRACPLDETTKCRQRKTVIAEEVAGWEMRMVMMCKMAMQFHEEAGLNNKRVNKASQNTVFGIQNSALNISAGKFYIRRETLY